MPGFAAGSGAFGTSSCESRQTGLTVAVRSRQYCLFRLDLGEAVCVG